MKEETPTEDQPQDYCSRLKDDVMKIPGMPDAIDPCTLHHRVFPNLRLTAIIDRKMCE